MRLSDELEKNVKQLKELLPIDSSFDFIARPLLLGKTKAFFLGVNGLC